jgi:membrane protein
MPGIIEAMERIAPRRLWEFVLAVVRRFYEDRSSQAAASLTYTTLLSIVPLLTVALALSTAFPVFDQAVDTLQDYVLENVLPDTEGVAAFADQLNSFTERAGRLTALGIAGLAFTGVMLIMTIDESMNRIFRVRRRRPIGLRLLTYWAVITLGPVLIGGSLSITSYLVGETLGWLEVPRIAQYPLGVLPFVMTWGALALLYTLVPHRHVAWRHGLVGAFFAGTVFEVAKRGFAFYISHFPTYAFIYGTFATILIFLVWVYVSWTVVLLGATLTAMLPGWRDIRAELHRAPGRELAEALDVLHVLAKAQGEGRAMPIMDLAREVGMLPYRAEAILERCTQLGWVAKGEKETWLLARDAASIKVDDVYRAFVFDPQTAGVSEGDLQLSVQEFSGLKSQ